VSKEPNTKKDKSNAQTKAVKTQETQKRRLPEPPRTAFNFVAAEIDERRRKRQSILTVGAVAIVAFTLTATLGLWAQRGASNAKKDQAAFETQIQAARLSVAQAFSAGDFDVPKHVETRLAQLSATLGSDVDILPLLELIRKSSIPGVKVTSLVITLDSSSSVAAPSPNQSTTTDPKAATTTTLPPKVTYKYMIRIAAEGTTFEDALNYKRALEKEPLFSDINVSQTGTPESSIKITADLVLATEVLTPRFNKIQNDLGIATAGTTPTTVAGAPDGQ
jgi:hypothetical protein